VQAKPLTRLGGAQDMTNSPDERRVSDHNLR
jgi:hypothetical protein